MSWSAHLMHTETGLAILFAGPVSRLDLTPEGAEHFASLIAIEARARVAGVVRTLSGENGSRAVELREQHALCCDDDCCLKGDERR